MYPEPAVYQEHKENITDQVPALKVTMTQLYSLLGAMLLDPAFPVRNYCCSPCERCFAFTVKTLY